MMEEEKSGKIDSEGARCSDPDRPDNVVVSPTCTQRRKVDRETRCKGLKRARESESENLSERE